MRADFQGCTICCQAAVQGTAYTWAQIAADDIGSHKAYLWFLLLEQINQYCGMRLAGIGTESFCIKDMQFVHAIGYNL